ncbi:2-C-methyl-D-erythritol 2,4-cyclodiphosphate synthase [SAR202 cluster bacterium AD-802-E10_MRT_200m]|nr:2-C-methyl-D-erythritol 2,4-cyclodiphosphate synthase [SAR202 cluster bacterium AD-802-E10_MRT_200m]
MRVGIGYDVHRLGEGRKLILGGVTIEFPKGLIGHSDGDALIHAVIDALMGAACLGDIGRYFPSDDPRYESINSLQMLNETRVLLERDGWKLVNLDATIIAEKPKLKNHLDAMSEELAKCLNVQSNQINVKAKTNDELGFLGAGEGIAVWAVALVTELA